MLNEDGEISFVNEIVTMLDTMLAEYEAVKGPLHSDLERSLVVSYMLGVLHCQIEAVWEALGDSPVFGALHPRVAFQECVARDELSVQVLRDAIAAHLRRKAWYAGETAEE
jgi:hypothetical protein